MIYQKGSNLFNVAIYIRLSREDGDKEESDSVGNQRKLLTEYVNKHDDFILYDVYIDDGFTGTNFNRPDFHRMIADIEDNKVNCVVVKDLSRFGRDYIDTGRYLERIYSFQISPRINVISSETGKVFYNNTIYLVIFNVSNHSMKVWSIEIRSRKTVININII